jgi:hypothetical protein
MYRVELNSGTKLLGTIQPAEEGETLAIRAGGRYLEIEFSEVVSMTRVKRENPVWDRIDGSVQVGMNYASGSEIGQANVGLNATFVEEKYEIGTNFGATLTTGSSRTDTRRFDWTANYARAMQERWFWLIGGGLNRNDELGIELRALGSGGFGRVLMRDNSRKWTVAAGLAASRESRAGEFGQSQIEGMLASTYSLFYFRPTKSDLSVDLALFPGITESDRFRGNFDVKMRWEIIKDFTWNLTYYLHVAWIHFLGNKHVRSAAPLSSRLLSCMQNRARQLQPVRGNSVTATGPTTVTGALTFHVSATRTPATSYAQLRLLAIDETST